jgi:hypothetical protein
MASVVSSITHLNADMADDSARGHAMVRLGTVHQPKPQTQRFFGNGLSGAGPTSQGSQHFSAADQQRRLVEAISRAHDNAADINRLKDGFAHFVLIEVRNYNPI